MERQSLLANESRNLSGCKLFAAIMMLLFSSILLFGLIVASFSRALYWWDVDANPKPVDGEPTFVGFAYFNACITFTGLFMEICSRWHYVCHCRRANDNAADPDGMPSAVL